VKCGHQILLLEFGMNFFIGYRLNLAEGPIDRSDRAPGKYKDSPFDIDHWALQEITGTEYAYAGDRSKTKFCYSLEMLKNYIMGLKGSQQQ
jgi:hypothetical protein